jgi:hypothetical protein
MTKFWTLIIYRDHFLQKSWVSDEDVLKLMTSDEVASIYRMGTDQYAFITETKQVAWINQENTEIK